MVTLTSKLVENFNKTLFEPKLKIARRQDLKCSSAWQFSGFFKKRFYLFIFREGREGEREGEKHQCVVASHMSPTGDLARNPGMCPDWESNRRPLVHGLALNPLSHTPVQGSFRVFCFCFCFINAFGTKEGLWGRWNEGETEQVVTGLQGGWQNHASSEGGHTSGVWEIGVTWHFKVTLT